MAKFKIKLLTSQLDDTTNSVSYLETPISEFYDQSTVYYSKDNEWQDRKYTYCYSFNEKVSFHMNGQKDLSFSMLKNIWLDNENVVNPFVSQLKNGSQILLIDQYDNEYIFTVKNIKYTLGTSNITYEYSCQDSFTYQNIRQSTGYTINNDISEADFIGAKTVDWWVVNKIQPECHLSYQYVPMNKGLYISKDTNNLEPFDQFSSPKDVKTVVKPIFTKENYPEYYEAIPFSVSGSNASATLISLASELGLMVNFREHNIKSNGTRTNVFKRYFWFEPQRNEKTADLRYSPYTNVQSFNFSHAGNTLTSVLNIESKEVEEEIISLIPEVPYFFSTLFASREWENSLFYDGYFTSVCKEQLFWCESGSGSGETFRYSALLENSEWEKDNKPVSFFNRTENAIYLHICNSADGKTFKIPSFYEKVCFIHDKQESFFYIDDRYCSPRTSTWDLIIKPKQIDENGNVTYGEPIVCNDTYSLLPAELLSTDQDRCYVRIKLPVVSTFPEVDVSSQIIMKMYRDASEEELEFAEIADNCPWLENKLIDFSYFLKQNILSKKEYESLLNTINNELRIVNGKLLYYSRDFYNAIRKRTEMISNLTNTLDSLGAAFNADAVERFKTEGSINDIKYFEEAYSTMKTKYYKSVEKTPIANYETLLTEYVNKYFKAQQRFLKNMYEFKKFFNQKIQWATKDSAIYKNTLSFSAIDGVDSGITTEYDLKYNKDGSTTRIGLIKRYLSFDEQVLFSSVTSNFNMYDIDNLRPLIKIYKKDKKTEATVVDKTNYTSFHKSTINKGSMVRCGADEGFNYNQLYYRVAYVSLKSASGVDKDNKPVPWPNSFTDETSKTDWYKFKEDETNVWYCSALPDAEWEDANWLSSIYYKTFKTTLQKTFIEVSYKDIVNDYIYKKFLSNPNLEWYYHKTNTDESVKNWWTNTTIDSKLSKFNPLVFNSSYTKEDKGNSSYAKLTAAINSLVNYKTIQGKQQDERSLFYRAHFPVTSVTYTGPNYVEGEFIIKGKKYAYQPANKKGQNLLKYIEYLKNDLIYEKDNLTVIENPFNSSEYVSYSIPVVSPQNETSYYRRVPKGSAIALAGASSIAATIIGLASPVSLAIAALTAWSVYTSLLKTDTDWEKQGWNTRTFLNNSYGQIYEGYHDKAEIIYANSATAYDEYTALTQQRKELGSDISAVRVISEEDLENDSKSNEWKDYEEVEFKKKKWYVQYKTHTDYNDYYNYYSKIAFTYQSAQAVTLNRGKTITFKNSYLRPVKSNEKINPTFTYRLLALNDISGRDTVFNSGTTIKNILDSDGRISKILYYFIYNNTINIDLTGVDFKTSQTWGSINNNWTESDFIFSVNEVVEGKTIVRKYIIFQEENFKREKVLYPNRLITLSNGTDLGLSYERRFSLYTQNKIYNKAESSAIEFNNIADLTEGLYKHAEADTGFVLFTPEDKIVWTNSEKNENGVLLEETKFYHYNQKGEYERVYTINQIKNLPGSFYFLNNSYYDEESLEKRLEFGVKVYLHQEYYKIENNDGETTYTLDSELGKSFIESATIQIKFNAKDETKLLSVKNSKGDIHSRNCTFTYPTPSPISGITNGHFWYLYHTKTDSALLFEEAAVIESQLTQYWQKAYNASLYCEYFLPEYWQPRINGDINNYNKNIIVVNESTGVPQLSSKYIPNVRLYNNGSTSRFPVYELEYDTAYNDSYTLDCFKQDINTVDNSNASDILKNNTPFINALSELGETLSSFTIPNHKLTEGSGMLSTNYYYVEKEEDCGVKWNNFLSKHSTITSNFEDFSGLYVMAYKILKSQFTGRGISRYEQYKNKQSFWWDTIYKQYSSVVFEDSFTSETASSSKELYLLGKNAFKDKMEPERSYSISLINAYDSLYIKTINKNGKDSQKITHEKYTGQELKVGEAILVDADDYYDTHDDIYNTISQYLFITDISYELRKDSDISLTVNNIKYQDKLIQRLVKLIK